MNGRLWSNCHSLRVQNNGAIVRLGIHIGDKISAGWSRIMKAFIALAKPMYIRLIYRLPIQSLLLRAPEG